VEDLVEILMPQLDFKAQVVQDTLNSALNQQLHKPQLEPPNRPSQTKTLSPIKLR